MSCLSYIYLYTLVQATLKYFNDLSNICWLVCMGWKVLDQKVGKYKIGVVKHIIKVYDNTPQILWRT